MNFQKKLPRVHITYDVTPDGDSGSEIPFVVGVIGDFYGSRIDKPTYKDRGFLEVNCDNFSSIMRVISPTFHVTILKSDGAPVDLEIIFDQITAFEPDQIVKKISHLEPLIQIRSQLGNLLLKLDANRQFAIDMGSYLRPDGAKGALDKYTDESIRRLINVFLQQLSAQKNLPNLNSSDEVRAKDTVRSMIKGINDQLSDVIDQVIHNSDFQVLEARWRNLHRLTRLTRSKSIKIKIFSCTVYEIKEEIGEGDFDDTKIFYELYETGYGTVGGEPFGCIVVDEFFDKTSNDIDFLRFMSKVCEAAHSPLLAGAASGLFGLNSFDSLHEVKDIKMLFSGSEWLQWAKFRQEISSKYINLLLPRVLVREPYSIGSRSMDMFAYEEKIRSSSDLCWGNPAYYLAERIGEAFINYGWTSLIRGTEGGGAVSDLPSHNFGNYYGEHKSVEVYITDRREYELSKMGLIPLCQKRGSSEAVFFSGQSVHEPAGEGGNELLAARASYIISASRFAHCVKIIMRDKIGSFQSAEQLQIYLQNWLGAYVLLSDDPGNELIKSRFPLREGRIWVKNADTPGEYSIRMDLKPHFQMEAVRVSLGFVAKLKDK